MKKNNVHGKAFISVIAVVFILCALAGCDADSVGQHQLSNEEISLDLSDPDVIAALFAASENKDSWTEDSEVPELLELDADEKSERTCFPMDCDVDGDGFAWECIANVYEDDGVTSKSQKLPMS